MCVCTTAFLQVRVYMCVCIFVNMKSVVYLRDRGHSKSLAFHGLPQFLRVLPCLMSRWVQTACRIKTELTRVQGESSQIYITSSWLKSPDSPHQDSGPLHRWGVGEHRCCGSVKDGCSQVFLPPAVRRQPFEWNNDEIMKLPFYFRCLFLLTLLTLLQSCFFWFFIFL